MANSRERDMACLSGDSYPPTTALCVHSCLSHRLQAFHIYQSQVKVTNESQTWPIAGFFFLTHRGSAPPSVGSEDSCSCAGSSEVLHCLCCAESSGANARCLEGLAGTLLLQAVREVLKAASLMRTVRLISTRGVAQLTALRYVQEGSESCQPNPAAAQLT